MPKIIKNRSIVNDDWTVIRLAEGETPETVSIPAGKVIVPLAAWTAQHAALEGRKDVGVWIGSAERPEELKGEVERFPVIAVDFPKFTDGRGYSIAYNLRVRLGYQGELRAIGDVLQDQLFYMQRVGFDAFTVRADKNIEAALKGLTDFSQPYQNAVDLREPLFRRVQRGVPA